MQVDLVPPGMHCRNPQVASQTLQAHLKLLEQQGYEPVAVIPIVGNGGQTVGFVVSATPRQARLDSSHRDDVFATALLKEFVS